MPSQVYLFSTFFACYLLLAGDDDDDTVEVEAEEVLLVGERRDLDLDEMCLGELKKYISSKDGRVISSLTKFEIL